jgi:hypothetical protein
MRAAAAALLLSAASLLTSCQSAPPPAQSLESAASVSLAPPASDSDVVVRLAVFWDAKDQSARIKLGTRFVRSDDELAALLTASRDDAGRLRKLAVVQIDAAPEAPWRALVPVLVTCRSAGFDSISFALPPDAAK